MTIPTSLRLLDVGIDFSKWSPSKHNLPRSISSLPMGFSQNLWSQNAYSMGPCPWKKSQLKPTQAKSRLRNAASGDKLELKAKPWLWPNLWWRQVQLPDPDSSLAPFVWNLRHRSPGLLWWIGVIWIGVFNATCDDTDHGLCWKNTHTYTHIHTNKKKTQHGRKCVISRVKHVVRVGGNKCELLLMFDFWLYD